MDPTYIKKIQQWVQYDNLVTKSKEDIKEVLEKRKELEDDIVNYIEQNKIDHLTVNISDGTIKFSRRNTTQSLTQKSVKTALDKYNKEHNSKIDVDAILNYIKDALESKSKVVMVRDIKS